MKAAAIAAAAIARGDSAKQEVQNPCQNDEEEKEEVKEPATKRAKVEGGGEIATAEAA